MNMKVSSSQKKVVTIGGGTGSFTVLSGLRDYPSLDITAIVSMTDDGGSTGKLRDEYGVLPPGDIRQCLVALSESSDELRKLFSFRFSGGTMHGQNLGNIIISGAEKAEKSFTKGLELIHKVLAVRGRVIPVCLEGLRMITTLEGGKIVHGEDAAECLDISAFPGDRTISAKESVSANPQALDALAEAELIVVCPGTIHASIIPNFLPKGMSEAFKKSKAKKVFICNLMNKHGQTNGYTMHDHVAEIEKYAGKNTIEYVIFNSRQSSPELLKKYQSEGEQVYLGTSPFGVKYKIIKADIIADRLHKLSKDSKETDLLHAQRTLIRHDTKKLAKIITGLL